MFDLCSPPVDHISTKSDWKPKAAAASQLYPVVIGPRCLMSLMSVRMTKASTPRWRRKCNQKSVEPGIGAKFGRYAHSNGHPEPGSRVSVGVILSRVHMLYHTTLTRTQIKSREMSPTISEPCHVRHDSPLMLPKVFD